jgi:hypothetical protein
LITIGIASSGAVFKHYWIPGPAGRAFLAGLPELDRGNNPFFTFKNAAGRSVTEAARELDIFATAHREPFNRSRF